MVIPKRDLLSLSHLKHALLGQKKKEKKEKKFQPATYSVTAGILLLLLLFQVTRMCKAMLQILFQTFIPYWQHSQFSIVCLFILFCLYFLLQVTYLKTWAMNTRMLFLEITSNTHFSDTVFDSLLPVKFAWNSKICKFMLPTMCQNQLSNTVPQFLLRDRRRNPKGTV